MKFTEEQAREALRAELTNKNRKPLRMSEKTLASQTSNLIELLADDEIGLPDFTSKAIKFMTSINEDIGKDKSENYKRVKKEIEDEANKKDTESEHSSEGDSTQSPEVKNLMERIAALELEREADKKRASIEQKKREIIAKMKSKGVADDEWLKSFMSEVSIADDIDVEQKADSFVKLYNKSNAANFETPTPLSPHGTPIADNFAASIKAASALAKNERAIIEQLN